MPTFLATLVYKRESRNRAGPSPSPTSAKRVDVRTGSCLCGKVRYELEGEPMAFRICHCVNCRKVTGSAFMANLFFPMKRFRLTQGQENLKAFRDAETASGVPINRWFCTSCGSNVYMQSTGAERAKVIVLQSGGIEGDVASNSWVPDAEFFPEQKRRWVECALKPKPAKVASKL